MRRTRGVVRMSPRSGSTSGTRQDPGTCVPFEGIIASTVSRRSLFQREHHRTAHRIGDAQSAAQILQRVAKRMRTLCQCEALWRWPLGGLARSPIAARTCVCSPQIKRAGRPSPTRPLILGLRFRGDERGDQSAVLLSFTSFAFFAACAASESSAVVCGAFTLSASI